MLTGVALEGDGGERREDILHLRAEELRRGAQGVPVLAELTDVGGDVLLVLAGDCELRSLEQVVDRGGDLDLPGMRASDGVDERVE